MSARYTSSEGNSQRPCCPAISKEAVFSLSYWSYAAMKISNKSFSLIQPLLVEEKWFQSQLYKSGYAAQTSMVGMISTIFLVCYASGQFFVGALADRSNLRYFIASAMIVAGLLTLSFGALGYASYRDVWIYCIVWALNGFAQACGWPSNLTVMNNWFGKKSRGLVFSAWSSNSNVGNVVGSVICGLIFWYYSSTSNLWQFTMVMCGLVSIVGSLPVLMCLVPDPKILARGGRKLVLPAVKLSTRSIQVVPRIETATDTEEENSETVQNGDGSDIEESNGCNTHEQSAKAVMKLKSNNGSDMSFCSSITLALGKRGVVPYSIIYACVKGVVYIYAYWMPLFLTTSKGFSSASAAYLSTIFDIGALIGGLTFGHITDMIGSRTLVILGMVGTGAALAHVLFSDIGNSIGLISCLLFFIGMSSGAAQILISGSVALDLGDAVNELNAGKVTLTLTEANRAKKLTATITGIIEGSGSAGAALLQYCVGALLVCEDSENSVTCTWDKVLMAITVGNALALSCLFYLKLSSRSKVLLSYLQDKSILRQ